jgi:hypothetical protein
MKKVYRFAGLVLWILSIVMVYLSYKTGGMPPGITGIGFLVIGWVFLRKSRETE